MRARVLAGVATVALLTGCTPVADDRTSVARRAAVVTPGPSTPTLDLVAVSARARSALLPLDSAVRFGGPVAPTSEEYDDTAYSSNICNLMVLGERTNNHTSHRRGWSTGAGADILHSTHGYITMTGAASVEAARSHATNCTSYTEEYSKGDVTFTFLQEIALGDLAAGTDAGYARCDRLDFADGGKNVYCDAYLARGPLMSHVSVSADGTPAATAAKLRAIVPAVVAALLAA